ncbi:MAG TPA: CPBP family glutamic-type intramembrane protease, partial [Candidatus Limnocylindrales bacterium]|nr:CPBP family glutamic-type intramembrane protease [Candidatus Limnocylindrales bacterium]
METTLRVLVAVGLTLLLVLLRLDAERFGAAEYDEVEPGGRAPSVARRLSWYGLGIALVVAIAIVHPAPAEDLYLTLGDRLAAIALGFLYAVIGAAQALAFAWLRYRALRLPSLEAYPGALVNALATAFVDEAAFRGAILGFLLALGVDPTPANAIQAVAYGLATRLGAPGREPYMLVLALLAGLAGGWLTVETGGIGAAFLGHAIGRFAVFVATGHPGRVAPRGAEIEDVERRRRPPAGWRVILGRDA